MRIKVLKLVTIIFLTSINLFAQKNEAKIKGVSLKKNNEADTINVRINSTFLLLGTLNDYINHKYVTQQNQFDRYYEYEKPLMKYVDSIAKKDFNIQLVEEKNCFVSNELSLKMNTFYNENKLIDNLFDSNEKKISFILGVYFRNGEKINNDIFKIQLANSPKNENVYKILKQLGCKNIFFKRLDNIPTQYIIYFQATKAIKEYFKIIESEVEKLLDSKIKSLRTTDEIKQNYREIMAKENLKIIELFK